jgi:DeoR/GlpR family transcriptional regulator of sugar metabolism
MVGKITKLCIDNINFSKAFIGIDGYTDESGFTSRDFFRAEISTHIIEKCDNVFILSDSAKFGKTAITNICYASDIKYLITDTGLPELYYRYFAENQVNLFTV